MVLGIGVFLYVQPEIEFKLLGVLRTLGVRDSVYWASWWIPFVAISTLNSILGAFTAKMIDDVHVFEVTSFGTIFVSILMLNLGMIGFSFFFVAVAGGSRALAAFILMFFLVLPWIPRFFVPWPDAEVYSRSVDTTAGLFWVNGNTVSSFLCRKKVDTCGFNDGASINSPFNMPDCANLSVRMCFVLLWIFRLCYICVNLLVCGIYIP